MKRFLKSLALGILLALPWVGASAQQVNNYCWVDAGPPVHWAPCNSTNPLAVSGSFVLTPSGTQNVNLTQILGAAPSLTNPLWVFPATGATFPVSGTVAVTQSTSPWVVSLASTTLTGNVTVVGPTADGSPATTPPVLVGGTSDGTATGTVDVWKITTAGIGYVNNAPSAASDAGLTPTTTSALAANLVVKASAGNLYSFEVSADSTLSAAAWWIMLYNATSAPVDGAVTPLKCYALPSGATSYAAAFPVPVAFSTGITIGVSTAGCFTKTASTHAFISGDAQ